MNHSGDAAEQIVRLSLEGVEVAAKITGTAAKEVAAFLIAALKNKNSNLKLKGKARLNAMLKSGKALDFFAVKQSDLKKFAQGAKQYGIVYCVRRSSKNDPNAMCDIIVKAEDAPKINRVVEVFKFATVDKAKIESEIIRSKAEKSQGSDRQAPDRNDTEKLLDELLPSDEGKAKPEAEKAVQKEAPAQKNPEVAKTTKTRPSAPTSESRSKSARGTSSKPSVKEELREIKATRAGLAAQQEKEADAPKRDARQTSNKPRSNAATTHKQPQGGKKSKSTKTKER